MKAVALALSVVAAVSWAAPQGGYNRPTPSQFERQYGYAYAPAQYSFEWDVNHPPSGNFYGHQEQRDGAVTRGSYYVQLPDTRLMRVDYYVDETGYHPTVTFEGEAQYPTGHIGDYYNRSGRFPGQVFPRPIPLSPFPTPSNAYSAPGK